MPPWGGQKHILAMLPPLSYSSGKTRQLPYSHFATSTSGNCASNTWDVCMHWVEGSFFHVHFCRQKKAWLGGGICLWLLAVLATNAQHFFAEWAPVYSKLAVHLGAEAFDARKVHGLTIIWITKSDTHPMPCMAVALSEVCRAVPVELLLQPNYKTPVLNSPLSTL